MTIDTILVPIGVGIEMYYHRIVSRFLAQVPTVYYKSDHSVIRETERVYGVGVNLFLAFDLIPRFQIQAGGGTQYQYATADVSSEAEGLFKPVWVSDFVAALNVQLLKYEHGSIDANFRGVKGFGTYGNTYFQSLLGFTFEF